jgi:hypothetical protein
LSKDSLATGGVIEVGDKGVGVGIGDEASNDFILETNEDLNGCIEWHSLLIWLWAVLYYTVEIKAGHMISLATSLR